jgi:hypothetical protein
MDNSDLEIIFTYTRREAIDDSQQFLADGELVQIVKDHRYKWPMYYTCGVRELIQEAVNGKKSCGDWNAVFWNLMYMSHNGVIQRTENSVTFECIVAGVTYEFIMEVGPTDFDDPSPCLTLMLPKEQ